MAQDSSRAEFWDSRYLGGVTPWDAHGVPPALERWLRGKPPMRVLVPGCGTGYEVRLFASLGHDALAIDFSDAAVAAAQAELGALAGRVAKADFFAFEASRFDLVYERAFLCALPRHRWAAWAARCAELVRPGGLLAGFFYFDDNQRGPPFGIDDPGLRALLDPAFERTEDLRIPTAHSLPVFAGKERWQAWRRRL